MGSRPSVRHGPPRSTGGRNKARFSRLRHVGGHALPLHRAGLTSERGHPGWFQAAPTGVPRRDRFRCTEPGYGPLQSLGRIARISPGHRRAAGAPGGRAKSRPDAASRVLDQPPLGLEAGRREPFSGGLVESAENGPEDGWIAREHGEGLAPSWEEEPQAACQARCHDDSWCPWPRKLSDLNKVTRARAHRRRGGRRSRRSSRSGAW